jgi:hypothetical protein
MSVRLRALTMSLTLVAGLLVAPTANAATTQHTVDGVKRWAIGKYYGPTQYSDWGKATITGWSLPCGSTKYSAIVSITQGVDPTFSPASKTDKTNKTKKATRDGSTSPASTCPTAYSAGDGSSQPDSWYNPFSWDWGSILGSFWDNIFLKCASGAIAGPVGTAGTNVLVKLLIRGAKVYRSPQGWAILAIAGCWAAISI